MGYRSTALILILVFGIIFTALAFAVPKSGSPEMTRPAVSIITIPENASLASSGGGFEPSPIKVVIGVNNTVRWINQDNFMSSVIADESGDPDFVNAT